MKKLIGIFSDAMFLKKGGPAFRMESHVVNEGSIHVENEGVL
jgi:hypothetical protein